MEKSAPLNIKLWKKSTFSGEAMKKTLCHAKVWKKTTTVLVKLWKKSAPLYAKIWKKSALRPHIWGKHGFIVSRKNTLH